MIVKVQISQFSSDGKTRALIYNKSRSIREEDVATPEIIEKMKGRAKAFFEATVSPGKIELGEEADWQHW